MEPASRHDLGRMNVSCPDCGALHREAERLSVVVKIEAQVRNLLHEWKGQARCISRPTGAPSYISHSPGLFFQKILRTDLGIQLI